MQNKKIKRYTIGIAAAFVAIVSCLTGSQYLLTQKAIANASKPYAGQFDDTEANANLTSMLINSDHDISEELAKSGNTFVLVSQPEETADSDEAVLSVSDKKENGGSVLVSKNSYTYVVDYKSAGEAAEAGDKLSSSEGVFVSSDFIFHVAGEFSGNAADIRKIDTVDVTSLLEEGKTLREIADENGLKLVAVIDTGVNDVADYSIDFTRSGAEDKNGHGTNVAKTILANADGKALIISLKAMDDDGTGKMTNVYQALQWAKDQRVDTVNMSISAFDDGTVESRSFRNLVRSVIEDDITVVAAAGNFGSEASRYIPAGIEGVISVGTVDENLTKTQESNYGNVTYYEQTASTSEAAAIVTGKLASGSEEKKESLITEKDIYITEDGMADKPKQFSGFLTSATDGSMSYKFDDDEIFEAKIYYQYEWSGQNLRIRFYARVDHMNPWFHGSYYGNEDFPVEVQVNGTWYGVGSVPQIDYDSGTDSSEWSSWVTIAPSDGKVTVTARTWIGKPDGYYASPRLPAYTAYDSATFTVPGHVWNVNQNVNGIYAPGTANLAEFNEGGVHNTAIGTFRYNGGSTDSVDAYNGTCVSGTNWSVENIKPGKGLYLKSITDNGSGKMPNSDKTISVMYDFVTMTIDPGANGTYDNASGVQYFNSKDTLWDSSKLTGTGTVRGNPWKGNSLTLKQPSPGYYYVTLDPGSDVGAAQRERVEPTLNTANPWRIESSEDLTPSAISSKKTSQSGSISGLTYTYGNYNDKLVPNALYSLTLPEPEKFGYELKGWYTGRNGSGTFIGAGGSTVNLPLTSDTTLYAYFVQKNVTLTIQGDINNGNQTLSNINGIGTYKLKYQTGVDANKNPVYTTTDPLTSYSVSLPYGTRYEILDINGNNYYTYNSGSSRNKNHSGQLKSNTTATIAYKGIPYTVVFENNDDGRGNLRPAGSVPSVSAVYGMPVAIPTQQYTWRGREFKYWSNNSNADPEATPYITPGQSTTEPQKYIDLSTKKATLYAIWKVNETTLTVDPAEGTLNGSHDLVYYTNAPGISQDIPEPTPPEGSITITYNKNADDAEIDRTSDTTSWAFKGWLLNDDADGYMSDDDTYVHGVSFDTLTAQYFYASVALPSPTREGYTFLGWYEDEGFRNKAGNGGATNYHASGDITLYARWIKDSYSYDDTVEVFMNDDRGDRENDLVFRKEDANSGIGMTTVTIENIEYSFRFEVYEKSGNSQTLKYIIDTKDGLLDARGNSLNVLPDTDGNIVLTGRLELGKTYVFKETEAAPGYELAPDHEVNYTEDVKTIPIAVSDRTFPTPPPGDSEKEFKQDEYGRNIAGATFVAKDQNTGRIVATFETDTSGMPNIDFMSYCQAGHVYELTETHAPDGFGTATLTEFEMPTSADGEMPNPKVIEEVKKKELEVKKEDPNGQPLAGAEFQLFMKDAEGTLIPVLVDRNTGEWVDPANPTADAIEYKATTGANGIASFRNLPLRATFTGSEPDFTKSYYLVETKAPAGYTLLPHEIEIRLPDDGAAKATYTVKDGTVRITLSAGGAGTIAFVLGGLSLLLAGACTMLYMKKKQLDR